MPNRSIAEIFTDLMTQLTMLLRKEGQLARTEMSEKITQVGVGVGLIVGGSVLLTPALVILLQAGVSALITSRIVDEPWAPLIVGGGVLVIGLILLLVGMSRLKAEALVPSRTIQQIQSDVRIAKQQAKETTHSQARDSYDQQRAA
jgi:Putative Actinobacterial Holin-X, holin superfamily III